MDRLREDTLAAVDAVFDRFSARAVVPGFAWGVVADGALVHAGGSGTRRVAEDLRPDEDSVFRIASMTKSFTAATVMLLRDDGLLGLDDPVADWLPDVDLRGPTTDSPAITIRHLLTMSAGLPTDDPWGDRQQGLDLDRFAELLRGGFRFAWTPGTRFEYSNLGYGILGRIVTRVAGMEYRDVVRTRLLEPLGMTATTYLPEDVAADRLALGYVRRDEAWIEEPIDPYGALAAMGGILTSVRDLARWVAEFTDAVPPRDDPETGHPLRRASRREMQQVHRPESAELRRSSSDAAPEIASPAYGYGLSIWEDLQIGRIVGHGGGYPGFGSHMRWHPASGLGVVGVANARYGPVYLPVREALALLVEHEPAMVRRVRPWPATIEARAGVERLLAAWDQDLAERLFAMNVDLDEPLERRRATVERLRAVHGTLRPNPDADPESVTPAHLSWWLVGERGRLAVDILLDPELPPRVQRLTLTSVPEPPAALAAIAARIVDVLGAPCPSWPADLALADTVDSLALGRALRAAEAGWGPVTLGPVVAGDGDVAATWRLGGRQGPLDLELQRDRVTGALTRVAFVPRPLSVVGLAN
jgi:CubicO group peptidase (beta-lactamase class C family)